MNAKAAISAFYELTRFIVNPGTMGKSEVNKAVSNLLLYTDGIVLPAGNQLVQAFRDIRKSIAPPSCTNRDGLEAIASVLRDNAWTLPGMDRTFSKQGIKMAIRQDLGQEFEIWLDQPMVRNTEGLFVELELSSDPHKVGDWSENFGNRKLKRKCYYIPQIKPYNHYNQTSFKSFIKAS